MQSRWDIGTRVLHALKPKRIGKISVSWERGSIEECTHIAKRRRDALDQPV